MIDRERYSIPLPFNFYHVPHCHLILKNEHNKTKWRWILLFYLANAFLAKQTTLIINLFCVLMRFLNVAFQTVPKGWEKIILRVEQFEVWTIGSSSHRSWVLMINGPTQWPYMWMTIALLLNFGFFSLLISYLLFYRPFSCLLIVHYP